MKISSDLRKKLQEAGLSERQLSNEYLQIALEVLMGDDNREAIKEADRQLKERKELLMENSEVFKIAKEFTTITDERAKNAVKLYSAIYKMQRHDCLDSKSATETAEHVTCAYLGAKSFTTINAASVYDNDGDDEDDEDYEDYEE